MAAAAAAQEEVRRAIAQAEEALTALSKDFEWVNGASDSTQQQQQTPLGAALANIDPLDAAKVRVATSLVLASLYYSLPNLISTTQQEQGVTKVHTTVNMKCGGLEPRTHDVMKELARVHLYVRKFQSHKVIAAAQAQAQAQQQQSGAAEQNKKKKKKKHNSKVHRGDPGPRMNKH